MKKREKFCKGFLKIIATVDWKVIGIGSLSGIKREVKIACMFSSKKVTFDCGDLSSLILSLVLLIGSV